jgi:hypothetical protein
MRVTKVCPEDSSRASTHGSKQRLTRLFARNLKDLSSSYFGEIFHADAKPASLRYPPLSKIDLEAGAARP